MVRPTPSEGSRSWGEEGEGGWGGENGKCFARRAAHAHALKKSVPAGWPTKCHFGTIWVYRGEHLSFLDWHDAWTDYCGLKLAAPVGLSPPTLALSLDPTSCVAGGAHQPLTPSCPPSPCPAFPHLPTPPSVPLTRCANAAPGLSLLHCSVAGPHGGGQLPSPLAWGVQVDTPVPPVGDPSLAVGGGLLR